MSRPKLQVYDIKIDYQGKIIFADNEKIYSMDINTLKVWLLAEKYSSCSLLLTRDDKGLCLSMNSKRDVLYYAEKLGRHQRVFRLDLRQPKVATQKYMIEDAHIRNMVCLDDTTLYVLTAKMLTYYVKVINVASGEAQDVLVTGRYR